MQSIATLTDFVAKIILKLTLFSSHCLAHILKIWFETYLQDALPNRSSLQSRQIFSFQQLL